MPVIVVQFVEEDSKKFVVEIGEETAAVAVEPAVVAIAGLVAPAELVAPVAAASEISAFVVV